MSDNSGEHQLLDVAQQVLEQTSHAGIDQAEVGLSSTCGFTVTARNGDVEKLEHNDSRSLSVTAYIDKHKASVSASDFSAQAITDLVATAVRIAQYTAQDDCAGLADAELMAQDFPELGIDKPWDLSIENAIDMAVMCENEMREQEHIVNTDGATVSTARNISCYANTHGFAQAYACTQHGVVAVAVAGRNGTLQRDYWYSSARCADDLEDIAGVGRKAALRATRRLGAHKATTNKVPILFEAPIATSLFATFASAIDGDALYRKTSFLPDAMDKPVFPEFMQISDQPHLYAAAGSAPFDAEGVATRTRSIVQDGVLRSFILNSYSARKLTMQTTGNAGGVHNLVIDGEMCEFDAMLKAMGTGLLVTELIGHGINPVTGDYSRGAFGFWVENGEIQYPVEAATIAGNLKDMFRDITMLGNDIDKRGNIHCGSVLVGNMILAA